HGRDILAPVAGHLSLGLDPHLLGPAVQEWAVLESRPVEVRPEGLVGEVVFVDDFGNLITNLPGTVLDDPERCVFVGEEHVGTQVRTYADAVPGTPIALRSSTDHLEIAITQGNAAARLQAGVGTPVRIVNRAGVLSSGPSGP